MGEEERGFTVRDRRAVKLSAGKVPEPGSTVRDPEIPERGFIVRDGRAVKLSPGKVPEPGSTVRDPEIPERGFIVRDGLAAQRRDGWRAQRDEAISPGQRFLNEHPLRPADSRDALAALNEFPGPYSDVSPGSVNGNPSLLPTGAPGERHSRVIPQDVKIAVAARDQGKCVDCGTTTDLHFDHKIPWSKGGTNTVNNIQLMCGSCNRRKGADDISDEAWLGQ
jgi:hypothetical protein